MPETRNSKTSGGSPSADKNPSNEFLTSAILNEILQLQERMFKVARLDFLRLIPPNFEH